MNEPVHGVADVTERPITRQEINPALVDPPPVEAGKAYLFRCVTHYQVGRVVKVTDKWITLADACWVADTGNFGHCLKEHKFTEFTEFPDGVVVASAAVVDLSPWGGELPHKQS